MNPNETAGLKIQLVRLLTRWDREIKLLSVSVKRLRNECKNIEGQYNWDNWKQTEQRFHTLKACYDSLKEIIGKG